MPVGDVDFSSISALASTFNRADVAREKEVLLEHKEEDKADDVDDLLDLDWSNPHKTETEVQPAKAAPKPTNDFNDDDLFGVDITEQAKPVQAGNTGTQKNQELDDLDFFGGEEVRFESPNKVAQQDDLMMFDDDIDVPVQQAQPAQQTQPAQQQDLIQPQIVSPVQNTTASNQYAFLDNVHTLDTLKAIQNHAMPHVNDDDDFVESDVTFAEPTRVHAFESNDIIIAYSSRPVS